MPAIPLSALFNFRTLLIIAPVLVLTQKGWINLVAFVMFVGASIYLVQHRKDDLQWQGSANFWRKALAWCLAGPFIAVGIGQLLRQDFYPPNFDAPLRLLLCVPVFFAISRGWLQRPNQPSITHIWATLVFPLTLLWTLVYKPSHTNSWGASVLTTNFVDPLSFGSLSLLLTLLSFAGLTFYWQQMGILTRLINLAGILAGIYLAVMSGSRTGWANIPVFITLWATFFAIKTWGWKTSIFITVCFIALAVTAIALNPYILAKMHLALEEIRSYRWSEMNPDGSVTLRISFYRMAMHYFLLSPFAGWGDLGWMARMHDPALTIYASEFARDFPRNGFHNEILTSTVRSGISGLLASSAFFFIPIVWAIRQLNTGTENAYAQQILMGLFLMVHLLIAGMTTEVTNLVFLGSFIGILIANLFGEGNLRRFTTTVQTAAPTP